MHKHSLFCRAAALVLTLALTAALAGSSPAGIVIPSTVARLMPGKSCGEE